MGSMKKSLKQIAKIGTIMIILLVFVVVGYLTWNFIKVNMSKQEERDETPPILEIKDVTITQGESYNVYSFLEKCSDNKSEKCAITFATEEMGTYSEIGTYEIVIIAKDEKENESRQKATLTIVLPSEKTAVGSPKKTTPEKSPSSKEENTRTLIKTAAETKETSENHYGTIKREVTTITYNLYSDGTKEYAHEMTEEQIDYSGYETDYEKMESEATEQVYATQDVLATIYPEIGLENIDIVTSSLAVFRAMEIGYSNKNDDTRPDGRPASSILEDGEYPKTMYKEMRLTNTKNPREISQRILNEFAAIQTEGYTKIGIGGAIVLDTYYWVIIFSN